MTVADPSIVVTGATGFVGSHVVEQAQAAKLTVRALARKTSDTTHLESIGADIVRGDVVDERSLSAAFDGADCVIHVAGLVAARDEAAFARVNVFGTRVVTEAAIAAGVRRLLLVSSLAARGPSGSAGPVSDYGRSKLAGEHELYAVASDQIEVSVIRPTVIYGPRDRALLPVFRLAREGIRAVLSGVGLLTVVHVSDLARGLVALAGHAAPPATPLEVTDGGSYRWHDVIGSIAEAVGRPGAILEAPGWLGAVAAKMTDLVARVSGVPQLFGTDKLGEMRGSWEASPEPFWSAAGHQPHYDMRSGAMATAEAYRAAGWLRS